MFKQLRKATRLSLLAASILACSGPIAAQANDDQTTSVTRIYQGTVTRADTREPVPGTTVTARTMTREYMSRLQLTGGYAPAAEDLEERGTTVTDQGGRYRLRVDRLGLTQFAWVEGRTTTGLQGTGLIDISLPSEPRPADEIPEVTSHVSLYPKAPVEGQVTDEQGTGLTSVTVRLNRVSDQRIFDPAAMVFQTAITTNQGRFRFPATLQGLVYSLSVEHDGYEPAVREVTAPTTATLIQLRPGGATLAGTLLDAETNRPVPATTITLFAEVDDQGKAMKRQRAYSRVSGKAGEFEFTGMAGGFYSVQQHSRGYQIFPGKGAVTIRPLGRNGIQVQSGETTVGAEIYLFSGYTIEGQVVSEDGKPLSGVKVSTALYREASQEEKDTEDLTGENGRFQVKSIYPTMSGQDRQLLSVRADKRGWIIKPDRNPGYSVSPGMHTFPIEPGATRAKDVTVTMQEALTINGRVMGAGGEPAVGADIRTNSPNPSLNRKDWPKTDEVGYFSVDVMPDSKVMVESLHPALGYAKSDQVSVEDRATTIPDLILSPWASLAGVVVDPDGKPVEHAHISAFATIPDGENNHFSDVPGSQKLTDTSGRFEIPRVHSVFEVTLTASAQGFASSANEVLYMDPGERKSDLKLILRAPMKIGGRVVDKDGKPAAGASVTAWSFVGSTGHATTGNDGRFTLENLAEGVHRVEANDAISRSMARNQQVPAGTMDLELVLKDIQGRPRGTKAPAPNLLRGTVLDADTNKPLPDISVKGAGYIGTMTIDISKSEPGKFTAELPEPRVRLALSSPGYAPLITEQITWNTSEKLIERTYRLEKGRTVTARLVDGEGKPAADVRVRLLVQGDAYVAQQSEPVASVRSDRKGRVRFVNVGAGLQRLDIRPPSPLVSFLHEATVPAGSDELDLGDIPLTQGGNMKVTVRNASTGQNHPTAGVTAFLTTDAGNSSSRREGATGEDGTILMERLPAGMYMVSADRYSTRPGLGSSKMVTVETGKTAEVELRIGNGVVAGKLMRGTELVEGRVTAQIRPPDGAASNANHSDGIYRFDSLVPGEYEFVGQTADQAGRSGEVRATATIRDGDNPELILRLPNGTISGTVVDGTGRAVPAATVSLASAAPPTGEALLIPGSTTADTNVQGQFQFDTLSPGTYNVTARKDGVGLGLDMGLVIASADTQLQGRKIVLGQEGGTLVNVALDLETGRPIAEAWCYLSNDKGRLNHGVLRKSDGTITIESLPPGRYSAEVSSWGYSTETKEVEVKAGETARFETVLYAAGTLRWTIVPTGEVNLSDLTLSVKPTDPNSIEEPRTGKADAQGLWVVRGLSPGDYTATVSRPGKPDISVPATIIARQAVNVRTEVAP
jgi:protocatechuate 3,4-dioxygenase beta subunit